MLFKYVLGIFTGCYKLLQCAKNLPRVLIKFVLTPIDCLSTFWGLLLTAASYSIVRKFSQNTV